MRYTEKAVVIGVLEAADRPGGVISSIQKNGFLFETGPQSPSFPASVWQLVRELNLESEFLPGDSQAQRFIFHNGRLQSAPFSPGEFLSTRFVGLRSKWHVLSEPLRHTRPPDHDETLAQFVERKFGSEILDHLVDPFISTIFFGDARCPRGTHILAENSNHWIVQEQPELVLQAIESVLQRSERSQAAAAGGFQTSSR